MPEKIFSREVAVILLSDEKGHPCGVVIKNGNRVFYKIEVMNDNDIKQLFPAQPASI